jgi:hypothetical protein
MNKTIYNHFYDVRISLFHGLHWNLMAMMAETRWTWWTCWWQDDKKDWKNDTDGEIGPIWGNLSQNRYLSACFITWKFPIRKSYLQMWILWDEHFVLHPIEWLWIVSIRRFSAIGSNFRNHPSADTAYGPGPLRWQVHPGILLIKSTPTTENQHRPSIWGCGYKWS